MGLSTGTKVGAYEIKSQLGAGGMGEVYRARDSSLGRDVAIKMLPGFFSSDPERLRRFEQEARAAASLNHPNILAVHQMGTCEGAPYIVSELLEGLTLREHVRHGPLLTRKAVDYAVQIAYGLGAAHDKGIVHRDLKPENLFVMRDGRVKILDFGLAKLTQTNPDPSAPTRSLDQQTEAGLVMGTIAYMSPEQVRGEPADHRSDIFAFGAILYEMLSGRGPFQRTTTPETLTAILRDDPPSLSSQIPTVQPSLQRIVQRCLEKSPEQRFHSAQDLAFALESLSSYSDSALATFLGTARVKPWRKWLLPSALAAIVVVSAAAALLVGRHFAPTTPIRFVDVVLRRGQFYQARIAPDDRTVIYGASFRFGENGLYVADANTQVGRTLGLPNMGLLAISRTSELAVLLSPHQLFAHASNAWVGTLARVPLSGGTPRPVMENVQSADWSPDGSNLAISRYEPKQNTYMLEYPIGHVLYVTKGYVSDVRVSPDGKLVAFMDHPVLGDNIGAVAIVDQQGKSRTISPNEWPKSWGEEGLAWSASGKEVWFTNQNGLWASDLSGRSRSLLQMAGYGLYLRDIGQDGSLLLYQFAGGTSMTLHSWPKAALRDLSWLDLSIVTDISEDGNLVLFTEGGIGGGPEYMTYIRKTDGSPAVQLTSGRFGAISPDGQSAITVGFRLPLQLFLVPLRVGDTRQLTNDSINHYEAHWMRDNTHFVFAGQEPGHGVRGYIQSTRGDLPRAVTPEGCAPQVLSPDGQFILAECVVKPKWMIFTVQSGQAKEPRGFKPGETPLRWSNDGSIWVLNTSFVNSAQIVKVNPNSGLRSLWKEIYLDSFSGIQSAVITPDGNTFVHTDWSNFGSLRRVYGLK